MGGSCETGHHGFEMLCKTGACAFVLIVLTEWLTFITKYHSNSVVV